MSWYETLAAFDTETTGVDVRGARIVSASLVELDQAGEIVSRRDWLIDPDIPIPEQATRIHGITTERARAEGLPAAQGVGEIVEAVRGVLGRGVGLVVYNAPYDLTLLAYEAHRHGYPEIVPVEPVVDPIILDKQVDRFRKGKRTLDVTAAHYGVPLTDAHDAAADAVAAARVAQAIGARYSDVLPETAMELHRAQIGWAAEQQASFAGWMRQREPNWTSDRPVWPGGRADWQGPAMALAD